VIIDEHDVGIRPALDDLLAPGKLKCGGLCVDAPDLQQPVEFHDPISTAKCHPGPYEAVRLCAAGAPVRMIHHPKMAMTKPMGIP
jgi:hypothetical protein